jgi:hypothetical protein
MTDPCQTRLAFLSNVVELDIAREIIEQQKTTMKITVEENDELRRL